MIIDMHCHAYPRASAQAVNARLAKHGLAVPEVPAFDADDYLRVMDAVGIDIAVLSLPGAMPDALATSAERLRFALAGVRPADAHRLAGGHDAGGRPSGAVRSSRPLSQYDDAAVAPRRHDPDLSRAIVLGHRFAQVRTQPRALLSILLLRHGRR